MTVKTTTTTTTKVRTGMPRDRGVLKNAEYLKICFEQDADQVFVEYAAPSGVCAHVQGDLWRVHSDGFQPPSGTIYLSLRSEGKSPWEKFAEKVEDEDEIWIFVDGDITELDGGWNIEVMAAVQEEVHARVNLYPHQAFAPPKGGLPKVCSAEKNPIPVVSFKKNPK